MFKIFKVECTLAALSTCVNMTCINVDTSMFGLSVTTRAMSRSLEELKSLSKLGLATIPVLHTGRCDHNRMRVRQGTQSFKNPVDVFNIQMAAWQIYPNKESIREQCMIKRGISMSTVNMIDKFPKWKLAVRYFS